ncbi:MAG TPA: response regulator [Saprospiraceae bacterium]|nr:response regulator [Saprospiraceae bacterium]
MPETAHKVLIVDDDPYILMSLDYLMKTNGYEVFVARNGTEALQSISDHRPDLVLLDIMMPDVDGYAICSSIKSNPVTSHIKVVFMSAKTRPADIRKAYDLGAVHYVTKPFSTRELLKSINEILA